MQCNSCWKAIQNEFFVIIPCSHLLCKECAMKHWSNEITTCPICTLQINENDISQNELNEIVSLIPQFYGISTENLNILISKIFEFDKKQNLMKNEREKENKILKEKKFNIKYQQVVNKCFEYRKQREDYKNELIKIKNINNEITEENKKLKDELKKFQSSEEKNKEIILRLQQENALLTNSSGFQTEKQIPLKEKSVVNNENKSFHSIKPINTKMKEKKSKFFSPNKKNENIFQSKLNLMKQTNLKEKCHTPSMLSTINFNSNKQMQSKRNEKASIKSKTTHLFQMEKKKNVLFQSPAVNRPMFTSPLHSINMPFTPL